jgi:hypothetical protein
MTLPPYFSERFNIGAVEKTPRPRFNHGPQRSVARHAPDVVRGALKDLRCFVRADDVRHVSDPS